MEITINGDKREFDESLTIAALLETLGLADQMVLVEQNREVIPRDKMEDIQVCNGDTIEILRLAGGG
jgi:thiamine biosynthesis protein ThiS